MRKRKVMLVGLDGAMPTLIEKFCADGDMPNLSKLIKTGAYSRMLSQIPVATPINWASISTGAPPGAHNITGFWNHVTGERIDRFYSKNAFTNTFIGAERVWDTAESCGKRSVLMKFPGSWPSSLKNGAQVDGYCIPSHGASILDEAGNGCHSIRPLHKADVISLSPAAGWKNIDQGLNCAAETQIRIALKKSQPPVTYQMLVCGKDRYEQILLCREKDAAKPVARLKEGDWSDWIFEPAGDRRLTIRFKLTKLTEDASDLRLYHSQVYACDGFTSPGKLSGKLVELFGPFIEFATPHAWKYGWTDLDTCYEEAEYQIQWMCNAAQYLLSEPWDLFVTQMHWIDHVQHYFLPLADPVSPLFDKAKESAAWDTLRQAYILADKFVGGLMKLCDADTAMLVLSDHGNICDECSVALLPLFREAGLISTKKDQNGVTRIDWEHTLAYPGKPGNCDVYVNLRGRDECGCVEPEDYIAVRDRVISVLRELKDPRGKAVFSVVVPKEDAQIYGLFGKYVGDVVAVYAQGFTWSGHGGEDWDREDVVFAVPDADGMDYGAHHGPALPTAATEVCSNMAFCAAGGAGIKKGYHRNLDLLGPVKVLDIAPTICSLMDCRPPKQSQGAVLTDFLE